MKILKISVHEMSLKQSKDDKNIFYLDIFFVGGSVNVQVDSVLANKIQQVQALENLIGTFSIKPSSVIKYGRSITVFEVVSLVDISKG